MSKVEGASSTAFQDDGAVVSGVARPFESTFVSLGPPPFDDGNIESFLSKPIMVDKGTLSTLDTVGQLKTSINVSDQLLGNDMWLQKIKGYNLIRATAHFKFVVNANPFQQGRMILSFVPCYQHFNSTEKAARNTCLAQMTTQPNVELDIQDASCEFVAPYVTPFPYFERSTRLYDWGTLFVNVLSPLQTGSGGAADASWALFLWFTDVELAGPIVPESGVVAKGSRSRRRKKIGSLAIEEEADSKQGVISSPLSTFSRGMMVLGDLPMVGSYFQSLGSASSVASRIAKMFGYSKPLDVANVGPMMRMPFKGAHTTDGLAPSTVIGLHSSVSIEPMPDAFGATIDEMSFAFLKAIPAFWGAFVWQDTDVYGANLWSSQVSPTYMLETKTYTRAGKTAYTYNGQPAFMLSYFFQYWRGGVEVTLKFVKTKYHTGRLVFSYIPSNFGATLPQSEYLLREVIDLSTADQITLKIPNLRSQAWLSNPSQQPRTFYQTDSIAGTIRVHVLDQLRRPETASSSIKVLMYVRPAEDFEIAVPIGAAATVFSPESGVELKGSRSSAVENSLLIPKGVGNSEEQTFDVSFQGSCMGDPFVSVKQLCTAPRRFYSTPVGYPGDTMNINMAPSVLFAQDGTTGQLGGPAAGIYGDWLTIVSSGYAFCRGGYRLVNPSVATTAVNRAFLMNEATNQTQIGNTIPTIYTGNSDGGPNPLSLANASLTAFRDGNSGIDFLIPHFGRTPIRLNRYLSGVNPYVMSAGNQYPDIFNTRVAFQSISTNGNWLRAGADDFSLGYFIGFMPLVYSLV